MPITYRLPYRETAPEPMPSGKSRSQLVAETGAMTALLSALWCLTHRNLGYVHDGILYAYQALARLRPSLAADLYLKYRSQDHFTIFSPVYADFARDFGLTRAGESLLGVCAATFLVGSWHLARALGSRRTAWFATAFLILTVGSYGAYGIFRFAEEFLTARSAGEALTIVALALHFNGRRATALLITAVAMAVHPLMAFPGLLLLLCVWVPLRTGVAGALAGVIAAFALAMWAALGTPPIRALAAMDPAWLGVVRERSQFLFLQLWRLSDWTLNARPFLCLALSAWAIAEPRVRKLCLAAMLVGATGLAVGAIAGTIGPSILLLQGQAWRWVWITTFMAILMVPETAIRLWCDQRVGPICAVLLVAAWTFVPIDGTACAAAALLLWTLRSRVNVRVGRLSRWAAYGVAAIMAAWATMNSIDYLMHPIDMGGAPLWLQTARNVFELGIPGLVVMLLVDRWVLRFRSSWAPLTGGLVLGAFAVYLLPFALWPATVIDWPGLRREYTDWASRIPPRANVYVADGGDAPMFTWFTLERPNYLSTTQSAGVVFSRSIALAVRRRSEDLRPFMPADWRLLTYSRRPASAAAPGTVGEMKPITVRSLIAICADPELGFVIAKQRLGFGAVPHEGPGVYRHWSLYDCAEVRKHKHET